MEQISQTRRDVHHHIGGLEKVAQTSNTNSTCSPPHRWLRKLLEKLE